MKHTIHLLLLLLLVMACQEPEIVGRWDDAERRVKPYVELTECYTANALEGDHATTLVYAKGRVNGVSSGIANATIELTTQFIQSYGTSESESSIQCAVVGNEFEYTFFEPRDARFNLRPTVKLDNGKTYYGTSVTVSSDSKIDDGDLADAISITRCTYTDEMGFTAEARFDERLQDVQRAGFVYTTLNYSISDFIVGGSGAMEVSFCSVVPDGTFTLNVSYYRSVKVRAFVVLGNGRLIYGNQLVTAQRE